MKKARCSRCGKTFFLKGIRDHINMVHKGIGEAQPPRKREKPDSMADIIVDGIVNRETGARNPEWLDEMIDNFTKK